MFSMKSLASTVALFAVLVAGHGIVTSPTPRAIGAANLAACGTGVYNVLKSDKYGPIENAAAKVDAAYDPTACHLFFCRGLQYEDNKSNTRVYKPGTVVPFHVDIEAHHTGYANVSVVNLTTQKPIGAPLFLWPVYANDTLGPADWVKNETDFSVTIPDVGTQCTKPGACAIQWFWYAYNHQTYESCVDFTTA
ncbi:putative lytic polysaccharide mono-oxygenase, cellulose-degrading [Lyophyllum shimeji]|uniref:Lytic polysaccharide mono-oxygenase, cellulose-degrading n=1 Tax=Lyophyllum shimeji TaxID=47721 RepID=A0A9P3PVY1_LYOSH|nr:putative lytic polysaccharide mono-oxygenase, cellulose-degrading [Lyophyllum shimeji]